MLERTEKYVFESNPPQIIQVSPHIKIFTVTNLKEFLIFFRVPWKIYKDDVCWVPPLWNEFRDFFSLYNPFWEHSESQLFVAYKDNVPVGRIAAIIDYNLPKINGKKVGYFGFFECIQDFNIASNLLKIVQYWLVSKKMSVMRGPINGRIDVGCGFLYEGFGSSPFVLVGYSPKYYLDFAKNFGLKKSRDQLVYRIDLQKPIPPSLKEAAEKCEKKGIKIRKFNRFRINKEMRWWISLMKETFSDHWGYVDVSPEEIRKRSGIKHLRWIIDPGLFLVAEANNQPIAFKWSLPDYNQITKKLDGKLGIFGILKFLFGKHTITQGKFNLVGIKREYRGQGIGTCMNYYTLLEMKKRGYTSAECGWIDEKNIASCKTIEKAGAKLYKKFRVFEKKI